ncbi:MAG: GerMN domain-containing protein [Oscillospiraceae bacterium]|nr:GerMN domain-containing protein [Oscillospiraceae bacterium]
MKHRTSLLLGILILVITACTAGKPSDPPQDAVPIYFLAPTEQVRGSDALCQSFEQLNLAEDATPSETAVAVVQRLLDGSQNGTLLSPFPEDVHLQSLTIRDRRAYIDFSGSLSRLDGIALTLADYCLTLSLSAIKGIESVTITNEGRALAQQPKQIFRDRDVTLSTESSVLQLIHVSLYFLNEHNMLAAEERILEIHEGETQSDALITALLDGPNHSSLHSPIPEDFLISSIKVENGICRINLPASSLDRLPTDEDTQKLILCSLAQSLYSLSHIQEIHLLMDGTELEKFGLVSTSMIAERPVN